MKKPCNDCCEEVEESTLDPLGCCPDCSRYELDNLDDCDPAICPDCNGSGEGNHENMLCWNCKGKGTVTDQ